MFFSEFIRRLFRCPQLLQDFEALFANDVVSAKYPRWPSTHRPSHAASRPSDLRRGIELLELREQAMPEVLMIDAEPIRHIEMRSFAREARIAGRGVGLLGIGRTSSLAATVAMALAMGGGAMGLPFDSVIPGFGPVALPPDVDAGPSEDDLARIAAAQAKRDLKAAKKIENQQRSEAGKQAKA